MSAHGTTSHVCTFGEIFLPLSTSLGPPSVDRCTIMCQEHEVPTVPDQCTLCEAQLVLICKLTWLCLHMWSAESPTENAEAQDFPTVSLCDLGKSLSLAVPVSPPAHMESSTCCPAASQDHDRDETASLSCAQVLRAGCTDTM